MDDASLADLDGVLSRWRGPAYPELAELDDGRIEAERLEELRLVATERRAELRIAAGTAEEVNAELRALAAEHPLRERPGALLVDALAATGRTAEALRAYEQWGVYMTDDRPVATPDGHLALRYVPEGAALDQKLAALSAMASQTADARALLGPAAYAAMAAEEAFRQAPCCGGDGC